jgi:hypothetical protein
VKSRLFLPLLHPSSWVLASARLIACIICLAISQRAWAATIRLNGADVTTTAAPIERGGATQVNVTALATLLRLKVQLSAGQWSIVTPDGTEWTTRADSLFVESKRRRVALLSPVESKGASLYLPVSAIADIAGSDIGIDSSAPIVRVASPAASIPVVASRPPSSKPGGEIVEHNVPGAVRAGGATAAPAVPINKTDLSKSNEWQGFTLEKPTSEVNETPDTGIFNRARQASDFRLPPARGNMLLGLGMGFVQDGSLGVVLSSTGTYRGANVGFSSFMTQGVQGSRLENMRFSWQDDDAGKSIELGNLYSDLWGVARGARYSWRSGNKLWSGIGLYMGSPMPFAQRNALAFRTEAQLGHKMRAGTEVASDGSIYAQASYQDNRLGVFGYLRHLGDSSGKSNGFLVNYELARGISLYGGYIRSNLLIDRNDWRNFGVRIPLTSRIDLNLERTFASSEFATNKLDAAVLSFSLGKMRLFTRYQLRNFSNTSLIAPNLSPTASREFQTSAVYFANPRLRFELQSQAFWLDGRQHSEWGNLTTAYRVSGKTNLQFTTLFPQMGAADQWRVRLEHQIQKDLSLSLDYGQLTPFQQVTRFGQPDRGFMLMLRTHWDTPTPSRGGELSGTLIDMTGTPVPDALIRLGDYQTRTDDDGKYVFNNIPAGEYEFYVLESSLPADVKSLDRAEKIQLKYNTKLYRTLRVVPLHAIAGRVYVDANGNGVYDLGEEMQNAVVALNDFSTATSKDGSFAFHNVDPGKHTIRIKRDKLPSGFELISPDNVEVELTSGGTAKYVMFQLMKTEKAIVYQKEDR